MQLQVFFPCSVYRSTKRGVIGLRFEMLPQDSNQDATPAAAAAPAQRRCYPFIRGFFSPPPPAGSLIRFSDITLNAGIHPSRDDELQRTTILYRQYIIMRRDHRDKNAPERDRIDPRAVVHCYN